MDVETIEEIEASRNALIRGTWPGDLKEDKVICVDDTDSSCSAVMLDSSYSAVVTHGVFPTDTKEDNMTLCIIIDIMDEKEAHSLPAVLTHGDSTCVIDIGIEAEGADIPITPRHGRWCFGIFGCLARGVQAAKAFVGRAWMRLASLFERK